MDLPIKAGRGDRWIWDQITWSVTGCAEGRELQLRSSRQSEAAVNEARGITKRMKAQPEIKMKYNRRGRDWQANESSRRRGSDCVKLLC
jgi:hypothetical protein